MALLRGDAGGRFGDQFFEDLERLSHFFTKESIDSREYVLQIWDLLKNDAKAKKADAREPLERLYDMVFENRLFPELSEEQINHRLTGWLAGKEVFQTA
jgi:deoxyribonuclease-4